MSTCSFFSTLLVIDTSTSYLSLGLHHHGHTHCVHEAAGSHQSDLILPSMQKLLAQAGIGLGDVAAIAYAQGPGAFTGLRIGLGVAMGLAAPFGLPLIGIPCLDAVASLRPGLPCVLAATDARMGELFYAWYDTQNQRRLSDYRVGAAADIRLPENHRHGCGAGNAFALDVALPVSGQNIMPDAEHYLRLALSGRYPATTAASAELVYVRDKIALTAAEQAALRTRSWP